MSSKNKLNLVFGTAYHGWLPTCLTYDDFMLEIEISDVLVDPMEQLCTALIQLLKGIREPVKVIWHLEPYCYYLQLEIVAKFYKISLLGSKGLDSPMALVKEIEGSFENLILPLYRAVKAFDSEGYNHLHWERLDEDRIIELTKLMKQKKASLFN